MKSFIYIFIISFFSCGNRQDKLIRQSFKNKPFDKTSLSKIGLYDSLSQTLNANLSVLFKDKEAITYYLNGKRKDIFTASYFYYPLKGQNTAAPSIDELPLLLSSQLKAVFNKIGSDNILGFEISSDSSLTVLLRNQHLSEFY